MKKILIKTMKEKVKLIICADYTWKKLNILGDINI